jgi:hypothetical protein
MVHITKIAFSILLLSLLNGVVYASAYVDGANAYRSHDYRKAAQYFQLATQQESGKKLASSYYRLGASFEKLKEWGSATDSFKAAQALDGTLSFVKDRQAFLDRMDRDATTAASLNNTLHPQGTLSGDPASNVLTAKSVYVDPLLEGSVNTAALQKAATGSASGIPLKIAVLDHLPVWYIRFAKERKYLTDEALGHYANGLHKHLKLGSAGLVVVCVNGFGAGICLVSDSVSPASAQDLAQNHLDQIESGNLGEIAAMTVDFDKAIAKAAPPRRSPWPYVALVLVVLLAGIALAALRRRKPSAPNIDKLKVPLENSRTRAVAELERLNAEIAELQIGDSRDISCALALRDVIDSRIQDATSILAGAIRSSELKQAESDLNEALGKIYEATGLVQSVKSEQIERANTVIRREDAEAKTRDLAEISIDKRCVSFFSSQPAPVDHFVQVTLSLGGLKRKVLATREEAQRIEGGSIPAVRAFLVDGRTMPWYMYDGYDPYRDYWINENTFWSTLPPGVATTLIGQDLADLLFSRPAFSGSWMSPYGFAPGWDRWSGWYAFDNSVESAVSSADNVIASEIAPPIENSSEYPIADPVAVDSSMNTDRGDGNFN